MKRGATEILKEHGITVTLDGPANIRRSARSAPPAEEE